MSFTPRSSQAVNGIRSRKEVRRRMSQAVVEAIEPRLLMSGTPPVVSNFSETDAAAGATSITIPVADFQAAFTDADSDTLQSVTIVTLPADGTLTNNGVVVNAGDTISIANLTATSLKYTHNSGFKGSDSFTWNASDGTNLAASPASVDLTVQDTPPVVKTISKTVGRNVPLTFALTDFSASFTDANGDMLDSITITSLPAHGTLQLNGVDVTAGEVIDSADISTLIYTPTSGFQGTDVFNWNASDGTLAATADSTVTLTVSNTAPVLTPVSVSTTSGTPYTFSSTDFTNSFTDANGDTLQSVTITTLPTKGTLTLNGTAVTAGQVIPAASLGGLLYTPTTSFAGVDAFTWNASDGTTTASSAAVIGVGASNTAPTITDVAVSVTKNVATALTAAEFNGAFTDTNSDTLRYITITSLPTSGTLLLNGTVVTVGQIVTLANIPSLTFKGTVNDSFGWSASDGAATSATALVTLTPTNTAPVLTGVAVTVHEGEIYTFSSSNFTAAFTDANSDTLQSIAITSLPAHGTLTYNGTTVVLSSDPSQPFTILIGNISQLVYTPNSTFTGTDTFGWNASDGTSNATTAALVTLTVSNAAPTLTSASYQVLVGAPLTISKAQFASHFADTDTDDSIQAIKITSLPKHGTLTLADGSKIKIGQELSYSDFVSVIYTPKANFFGNDSFKWTASDGKDYAANSALVTLVVPSAFGVIGNGVAILNNDKTPSTTDFTDFGQMTTTPDPSQLAITRTYTIKNSGSSPLTISGVTVSGANSAGFSVGTVSTSLAAGESVTFTVTFAPTAAGDRTATITVAGSTADGDSTFAFAVKGRGLVTTSVQTSTSGGVVQYATTKAGSGAGASNGQILSFTYTGYLADGTVFDSTAQDGGTPLSIRLDNDYADSQPYITNDSTAGTAFNVDTTLIEGFEYGLQGIKVGESRTLIINATAGYGATGQGDVPAGATLIFEVTAVKLTTKQLLEVAGSSSSGLFLIPSGQKTTSASDATLFTLASGASTTTVTQSFVFSTYGPTDATGASIGSYSLARSGITISGAGKKNFTLSFDGSTLTVTYDPLTTKDSKAVIHIHTKTGQGDYNFAIEGTSADAVVDLVAGVAKSKLPKNTVTSGNSQRVSGTVFITNIGNSSIPASSISNMQVYAVNENTGAKTLLETISKVHLSGLGAEKHIQVGFSALLPASLASGTYTIEVDVNQPADDDSLATIPEVSTTNDSAFASGTFTVIQSYAATGTLSGSTVTASETSAAGSLTLNLQNVGNNVFPSNQEFTAQVIAVPTSGSNVVLTSDILLKTGALGINAMKSFPLTVNFTGALAAGSYTLEVILTPVTGLANLTTLTINTDANGNTLPLTVA